MTSTLEDRSRSGTQQGRQARHGLDAEGRYRIDRYDQTPAFSSFLPGVAGPDGVPLWCMYVNRGQAVVSFGATDKNNAVAEFLPAIWAYQLVNIQGFRTFCKIDSRFYEPFQNSPGDPSDTPTRTMWIEPDRLSLQEHHPGLGLSFDVSYIAVVDQPLPALVRRMTITNHSPRPLNLELLDGLAVILPAGLDDEMVKRKRRLSEAYSTARLLPTGCAVFSTRVRARDESQVEPVKDGNFYNASLLEPDGSSTPLHPIVDPDTVFGGGNDLITPRNFIRRHLPIDQQVFENRLMCALAPAQSVLEPGRSVTVLTLTGYTPNEAMLQRFLADMSHPDAVGENADRSRAIHDQLTQPAFSVTAHRLLDAYNQQNYLDNALRGGVPLILPSAAGPTPIHLFGRRHGDLERDYNEFHLAPHPLSEGPGNYRDICQNRRHDAWFHPDLFDAEIRMFASLLQANGYNPLAVSGYRYRWPADRDPAQVHPTQDPQARRELADLLDSPFSPGQLLAWADRHQITIQPDRLKWLSNLLKHCDRQLVASGHEGGYWIDHWTYITDLLEAFAAIYPDRVTGVLTDHADIPWFPIRARVVDRCDRYVRLPGGGVAQLNAVVDTHEDTSSRWAPVTLFAKLCALLAVKAVSLDHRGIGVEMEAGRPGWNDALNGLPGLFGSSTCETAETARLAAWLRSRLPLPPDTVFPGPVADLIDAVVQDLDEKHYDWDRAATLREQYRHQTQQPPSGTRQVEGQRLARLLAGIEQRTRAGLEQAIDPGTGLVHTYYLARPADARDQTQADGSPRLDPRTDSPYVTAGSFEPEPLPLFLEGQVHYLRLLRDRRAAAANRRAVIHSGLFDAPLKMYLLNESLERCSLQIGRARTFSRGWLENESVWLHMSYKYLLELVRCGLFDEFYADARTMLVPFMDPAVYGRSVLENSSFIGSSVSPDPAARGRGFVARLSGSTAEWVQIWLLLTVGSEPFSVENSRLRFSLAPSLPAKWFIEAPRCVDWRGSAVELPADTLACALFGSILLVYHNPQRRDTYGDHAVRPVRYALDGQPPIEAQHLDDADARRVRDRACKRLDVWLG